MSKVIAIMSMSLDGYVAGVNDGVAKPPTAQPVYRNSVMAHDFRR
jgi:hypothetical protein